MTAKIYILDAEEVHEELKPFAFALNEFIEINPSRIKGMIEYVLFNARSPFDQALHLWMENEIETFNEDGMNNYGFIHLNENNVKTLLYDLHTINSLQSKPFNVMPCTTEFSYDGYDMECYDHIYFGDVKRLIENLKGVDFNDQILVYTDSVYVSNTTV